MDEESKTPPLPPLYCDDDGGFTPPPLESDSNLNKSCKKKIKKGKMTKSRGRGMFFLLFLILVVLRDVFFF